VNPDDRVPVTLTAAQWNVVLGMLAEQPYRQSAALIQAIQMQCNQFGASDGHQHARAWQVAGGVDNAGNDIS
jgi:hypothetical protein